MRRASAVAALMLSILFPALAAADPPGPSFRGVGDAPGGGFLSKAYGVSADGRFVVGATEVATDKLEAFRWEDGALETLGRVAQYRQFNLVLPPEPPLVWVDTDQSVAVAASADGSVVVGRVCSGTGVEWAYEECAPARFDPSGPTVVQPKRYLIEEYSARWFGGSASDVTADGSAMYGVYTLGMPPSFEDAAGGVFRFQDEDISILEEEFIGIANWPVPVSPDGGAWATAYWGGFDTTLYTSTGHIALDLEVPGDVSKLGLVVVGQASSQAARWHGGSVTLLGDLPGGAEESEALAVSDAGHVVAGWGTSAAGREAFLWTPESGMRRLADVLAEHGLDTSGWTLEEATGLSASGRTVVGWGTNPSGDTEGFVATLPARVIPAPSLGPVGLALLVALLIAASAAAVRHRNGSPSWCASPRSCRGSRRPRGRTP